MSPNARVQGCSRTPQIPLGQGQSFVPLPGCCPSPQLQPCPLALPTLLPQPIYLTAVAGQGKLSSARSQMAWQLAWLGTWESGEA